MSLTFLTKTVSPEIIFWNVLHIGFRDYAVVPTYHNVTLSILKIVFTVFRYRDRFIIGAVISSSLNNYGSRDVENRGPLRGATIANRCLAIIFFLTAPTECFC
ncbi:hypothetical protein Y032_0002g500 [Ancylostoma ceylanicum]|uniref:Uncharacterized protein n=1 Tax=Ancylostoma ceylanicum TaxID=53326 RepID=A0A016W1L2_9BILA|nr:hypothetical protein Y032_0002g500 [Ancylostoma ceylanicum]